MSSEITICDLDFHNEHLIITEDCGNLSFKVMIDNDLISKEIIISKEMSLPFLSFLIYYLSSSSYKLYLDNDFYSLQKDTVINTMVFQGKDNFFHLTIDEGREKGIYTVKNDLLQTIKKIKELEKILIDQNLNSYHHYQKNLNSF